MPINNTQKVMALTRLVQHLTETVTDYWGLKRLLEDGDDSDKELAIAVGTRALHTEEEILRIRQLAANLNKSDQWPTKD